MSVDNFKPQIWIDTINRALEKKLVFGMLANREFEGEIQGEGASVKMLRIGGVAVKDYTANSKIDFEKLSGATQTILIDKSKYFAFQLDDLDKAQAVSGLMVKFAEEAAYQMADVIDVTLAGLYPKAGVKVAGAKGGAILENLVDLSTAMTEKNVPTENRWLVVSPAVQGEIIKALPTISKGENAFGIAQTNYIGAYAGFQIFVSNNVQKTGTKNHCMAGYGTRGMNLAMQLSKTVAGSIEAGFADYIKGLNLFGADITETGEEGSGKTDYLAEFEFDMATPKGK